MEKTELVYVTFIRTTPEKVWEALTTPEFTRQYWGDGENVSDWKEGSEWRHMGRENEKPVLRLVGKVVESAPPKRLVLTWAEPGDPADESRVSFEIEPFADTVRLEVVHGSFKAGSTMASKVSGGWPRVLSSLKSYLETGEGLSICSKSCKTAEAELAGSAA